MLACSVMVACTNTDEPEVDNGKDQKGDAYVTVKLSMTGNAGSRAFSDGGFVEGDPNEVAVNKAIFYFFDENGQGCANKYEMTNTANLSWAGSTTTGVDQESGAIVVIKNPIATPTSMLVLLNCEDPTNDMRPSLAQLQAVTKNTGDLTVSDVNYHIMSNAVYVKGESVMVGTTITEDNIATSTTNKNPGDPDDDNCTPVVVSVERLWAKVGMTLPEGENGATFTPELDNNSNEYAITAEIQGWWLASKADKTYLVKDLSSTYSGFTGTWWNDVTNKRSYWANMPSGVNYTNDRTWAEVNGVEETEYCLENTSTVIDETLYGGNGTATQYAAKAILKINDEPETFVRWLNTIYTEADFFQMIANAYNNYRIQVGDALYDLNGVAMIEGQTPISTVLGWNYKGKTAYDTDAGLTGLKNYEGIITVSATEGQGLVKKVGTAEGRDIYETVTAAAIQAEIRARIDKVLLWLNGQTYYYTDIIHNNDGSTPLYGVVRNHLYTLNVTGLTGMGTPVPNPELPINPERPEDDEYSHISAEVQIFSYKKVPTQDVTLQ